MKTPFPFSAIVGQTAMKQAMILTAIDPGIGGVLVFGDRGTGKSTAVRALAAAELRDVAFLAEYRRHDRDQRAVLAHRTRPSSSTAETRRLASRMLRYQPTVEVRGPLSTRPYLSAS